MDKGKGSCIMCDLYGKGALYLIIMLGHHMYKEAAWLHKPVCEYEMAMKAGKSDEYVNTYAWVHAT